MQTKSSYRVLKWTFIMGAVASLGACVVTTTNGSGDLGDGGESGKSTTNTAGKTSTAGTGGTSSTGGKSAGGSGGTPTSTGGTDAGGGGEGGTPDVYIPGLCQVDLDRDLKTPSHTADTTLTDDEKNDPDFACPKCLKTKCAESWGTCYGDTPTTACGFGSTEDAPGEFECIRNCVATDMSSDDALTVLEGCQGKCLDQCDDPDGGFLTDDTQDVLDCGQEKCLAECFTP